MFIRSVTLSRKAVRLDTSSCTGSYTYRMELQYDGTGLSGWAKQPGCHTVEGSLEKAFAIVLGQIPVLQVAGRTDAGVHARKQVVSLRLPAELAEGAAQHRFISSLNALTPSGITITKLSVVADDFDARYNACSRCYRYHISEAAYCSPFWRNYCWWLPGSSKGLNFTAMQEVAGLVEGWHDFTAFTTTASKHQNFYRHVMQCEWSKDSEGLLTLHIEANSFLRHMVRVLVGTIVEVGQGKRTVDGFAQLLQGAPREMAGRSAPAKGLFLWEVRYP